MPATSPLPDWIQQSLLDAYDEGVSDEEVHSSVRDLVEGTFDLKYLGSVPVAAAKLTPTMLAMFGPEVRLSLFDIVENKQWGE